MNLSTEEQPSSSSRLNLPPTMSRSSLSLETLSPSRHVDRMVNSGYQRSPSRAIYSDRFIPSRSGSNFALFNISPTKSPSPADGREECSGAYATLLRAALFGPESGVVPPATPEKAFGSNGRHSPVSPPSRNIFRYKTETRKSMHSLSPLGFEDTLPGVNHTPVKTPRKVSRSPYKVNIVISFVILISFTNSLCFKCFLLYGFVCFLVSYRFWMRRHCKMIFI